ncbi:MAG: tetratricopeptide repeat protein [Elusimicrobia bacterium]|nr:tetratricopeptide repeat protein [Elusimicrobiota bacterium]
MNSSIALMAALAAAACPSAFAYDDIRFLEPIKLQGTVARPVAVAASASRLYLLDEKKGQLHILAADGKFIRVVGKAGDAKDAFSSPKALAIDPDGTVFVADTGNSRIQVLDAEGNFLYAFGMKGSDPGRLRGPEGVAAGGFGRVYVSDTGNHRVQVFTREGIFLYGFGEKGTLSGQLRDPSRLFVDSGDFVYVLDSGNSRVQKFDPAAKAVKEFALEASDFALDAYGFMYGLEPKPAKVREIAPDGYVPGAFGSKGSGIGQFKNPTAIAAGPDGLIYVLDAGNARLQRIELANKAKVEVVGASTASKLLVSGPVKQFALRASAISAQPDRFYAYLPEPGEFVALDRDGGELLRFGRKSGKDASVTEGSLGLGASAKHGLFVSDTKGDKVQRFTSSGTFVSNFAGSTGFFDSKKKEGRVRGPRGVAVTEKGTAYVADTGNRRVDAFTPDGAFLFSFGPQVGPYELQEPVGVAWDNAGFAYVLDRKLGKVVKCEPSGGFVLAWGEPGTGPGQLEDPVAIAFDGMSYVYVLDAGQKRVAVFHRDDGRWVTNFFAEGADDRGLEEPNGLGVWGERLLVSDQKKGKVLAFNLRPLAAPPAVVSTAAVEGIVELKWTPSKDPWVARYKVWRTTIPGGPWDEVGEVDKPPFKDSKVQVYQSYLYKLAAQARTGDLGPSSQPISVFVPGAFNRAPIELASVEIGNMLPANYKWYLKNAVGKAVVVNNVNVPFQNVKLGFKLKDFMDFATEKVIEKLEPQGKVEVPLMATLNNKILDITEETPIQAEITVTYFEGGKPHNVSIAKPLRIYARNAMIWDNPDRVNAFITTNDPIVKDFQTKVRGEAPPPSTQAASIHPKVLEALRLWTAAGEAGIKFQAAANNPFETVSEDPTFPVDYTQFPRDTIRTKAGECDDVATLFASLFSGANITTALLDYPGHIALMFDTGESDANAAGLPESDLVQYDGRWWVPLEPTLIGADFADSHRHAITAYREMEKSGRARVIDPAKAVEQFQPVTMPAPDWTPGVPEAAALAKKVESAAKGYAERRYDRLKAVYEEKLKADAADVDALNQLGLLEVDLGRFDAAHARFTKALDSDAADAAALNNLGSVAFTKSDWAAAKDYFQKAAAQDPSDPGIWLNLAKTAARLKDADGVKEFGQKALGLVPDAERPTYTTALDRLSKQEN